MSNKETIKEVKPKDIQRIIASTNAQTASIEFYSCFLNGKLKECIVRKKLWIYLENINMIYLNGY